MENGFFSGSYWNPSVNVGLRLSWNVFDGFQTSARVQQRRIAVERAALQYEQTVQGVRLEVEQALRNLETAARRIQSQRQNVTRAELNYEYASTRLHEGVASPLEEREASDQLDQSRLNHLQAVYDYLVARSAFETAVGLPPGAQADFKLTQND
jgi:outer membrane protein TolC